MLWQITAPHFVAGFVAWEYVHECAPIIRYMRGWTVDKAIDYCRKKQWHIELLD